MAGKGGVRSTSFKKGQSGNPKGRPKESIDVKNAARTYTVEAIERLAFWMRSDNAKASVSASALILDRAWGKPTQPLSGDEDMPPLAPVLNVTISGNQSSPAPKAGNGTHNSGH